MRATARAAQALLPFPALRALAVLLALAGALACAATPQDVNRRMAPHLDAGDPAGALAVLRGEQGVYGGKNELLFRLEEGMLLHYLERWDESNQALEIAKRVANENFTKSVSRELGTYMINDTTVPYYGSPFELSLIHVVAALNHAATGDLDGALVEVRQLDAFLRKLRVDGAPGTFRDDGFGRFLGGMLYSEAGKPDEAFVAFQHALDAYAGHRGAYGVARPQSLTRDAARTATSLGGWATDALDAKLGARAEAAAPVPADRGRLVLVHYAGRAPVKVEVLFNITVGKGWAFVNRIEGNSPRDQQMARAQGAATGALSRESFQVAVPKYRRVAHRVTGVRVASPALDRPIGSERVAAVGKAAVTTLEDDIAWIRARAIARATVKYVLARLAEEAARQAGGDSGDALALAARVGLGIARNVSEQADVRSWFTAPAEITLAEVELPAGTHDLELRLHDAQGHVVGEQTLHSVRIDAQRRTFHIIRTAR